MLGPSTWYDWNTNIVRKIAITGAMMSTSTVDTMLCQPSLFFCLAGLCAVWGWAGDAGGCGPAAAGRCGGVGGWGEI